MDIKLRAEAGRNLHSLRLNQYPGRGFVIGMSDDGRHVVQVFWLMGRSENSRNRRLVRTDNIVRTEPVDPAKVTDSSHIIYNAMREENNMYVVSNGDHTDTVFNMERHKGGDFRDAMREREYEPPETGYTSRIAGIYRHRYAGVSVSAPIVTIATLSRRLDGGCLRAFYEYDSLPPGYGYCIHTYAHDGDPPLSFNELPYPVLLFGKIGDVSDCYWTHLNEMNRVALVTKFIDIETGESDVSIINRY